MDAIDSKKYGETARCGVCIMCPHRDIAEYTNRPYSFNIIYVNEYINKYFKNNQIHLYTNIHMVWCNLGDHAI